MDKKLALLAQGISCFFATLALGLVSTTGIYAQTSASGSFEIGFPSPEAASIGKFGDNDVNLSRGVVTHSIPVHSITAGDLSLPILLNYSSEGVPVKNNATWTGIDWTLLAGGAITRTMRGIPDEHNSGHMFISTTSDFQGITDDYLEDLAAGMVDSEPDLFHYNFGGYSGTFMIDSNGDIYSQPFSDLLFEYTGTTSIISFTVTDKQGVKYTFAEEEYTDPDNSNIGQYNSAWYLTKIESPYGAHEITISYQPYTVTSYNPFEIINYGRTPSNEKTSIPWDYTSLVPEFIIGGADSVEFVTSTSTIDGLTPNPSIHLDEIKVFRRGSGELVKEFELNYTMAGSSGKIFLEEFKQVDGSETINHYSFEYNNLSGYGSANVHEIDHYGYFNDSGETSTYLPSGVYKKFVGNDVEYFEFSGANRGVNANTVSYGMLNKITYPTGGYSEFEYESRGYSKSLSEIATFEKDSTITFSYNTTFTCPANEVYTECKEGTFTISGSVGAVNLSTITSGFTESNTNFNNYKVILLDGNDDEVFTDTEYTDGLYSVNKEIGLPNDTYTIQYLSESDDLMITNEQVIVRLTKILTSGELKGPGVRIKQISTYDGISSTPNVKKYWYNDSGAIYQQPNYQLTYDPDGGQDRYVSYGSGGSSLKFTSIVSNTNSLLGFDNRGFAIYSEVSVSVGEDSVGGYEVYTFSDEVFDNYGLKDDASVFLTGVDVKAMFGNLEERKTYDASGNLIRSSTVEYDYFIDGPGTLYTRGYRGVSFYKFDDHNFKVSSYDQYFYWVEKEKEVVKEYDGSDFVETEIRYEYIDSNKLPRKITEQNSDDTERTTGYTYAYEEYNGIGHMEDLNMLSQPYAVEVQDGNGSVLTKNWTTWAEGITGAENNVWLPHQQWQWDGAGDHTNAPSSSNAFKTGEVTEYDGYGNFVEVEDYFGAVTKYYYGSDSSPYSQGGEHGVDGIYLTAIEHIQDGEDASNCSDNDLCTKATYDDYGRVTSVVGANGSTTSYTYDAFSRLESVQNDAGDTVSEYEYTYTGSSFSSSNPNWTEVTMNDGTGSRTSRAYADGLGRGIQSIASGDGEVIIAATAYDELGRPWKTYKPFDRSGTGLGFENDYETEVQSEYGSYAFVETLYEDNPLNRPGESIPMGGEVAYGSITTDYSVETVNSNNYQVTTTTDQVGKVTKTYIDGWGRTFRTVADPSGINAITEFVYDELDLLAEIRLPNYFDPPSGSTASDWIVSYTYDVRGNLVSKTSNDFGTAEYVYDALNRLRFSRDANQATDNTVSYTGYDELGRIETVGVGGYVGDMIDLDTEDPETFETDENVRLVNAWDTEPDALEFPWNQFQGTEHPLDNFDPGASEGMLVAEAYRFAATEYPQSITEDQALYTGTEVITAAETIEVGNSVAESGSDVTLEAGLSITLSDGFVAESGATLSASIDGTLLTAGGISEVTKDSPWQLTLYSYDSEGRVDEKHIYIAGNDQWDAEIAYTYNRLGEVTRRKLQVGEDVLYHHYAYNALGQLESVTITSDGTADTESPEIEYTYLADGSVDEQSFKGGTDMEYSYDIQSRLTEINNPVLSSYKFAASYDYFDNGNISSAEFRNPLSGLGGDHIRYQYDFTYDALNRLEDADYSYYDSGLYKTSASSFGVDLTYDNQSNIESLTRNDENGAAIDDLTYNYIADGAGSNRLASVSDAIAATTEDWDAEDATMGYDANGNLTSQTGKFTSMAYDYRNLPVQVDLDNGGKQVAHYNAAGLRIFKEYTPSGGGSTYTYYLRDGQRTLATIDEAGDLNVNLIGMGIEGQLLGGIEAQVINEGSVSDESESNDTEASADGPIALNFEGLIIIGDEDWVYFNVIRSGTVTLNVRSEPWDGTPVDMPWVVKKNGSTVTSGSGTGSFSVSPGSYYIEINAGQGMTEQDYYGVTLSAEADDEYATRYFLKDHLGSTRAIVDELGTHLASYDYYPFGLEMPGRSSIAPSGVNNYKFTSHERDEEGDMYIDYMNARTYDPALARFLQVDPLLEYASPYIYVGNNPINMIDPTGMSSEYTSGSGLTKGYDNAEGCPKCQEKWNDLLAAIKEILAAASDVHINLNFGDDGLSGGREYTQEQQMIADAILQDLDAHGDKVEGIYSVMRELPGGDVYLPFVEGNVGEAALNAGMNSIPVGKLGQPLKLLTNNVPQVIDGVKFTGHALDQMQSRGVISPTAVLDVVNNATSSMPGNTLGTTVFFKDNLKVVTNTAGDIVTVITQ